MWRNIKHKAWIELLLASASVIAGLLIGPILERLTDPLFSIEIRAALVSVLILGFLVILGLASAGILIRRNEQHFAALEREIQEIQQKIGLSSSFVYDLPRGDATGEVFRKASEMIERAQKSIWVLYYQCPSRPEDSEVTWRSDTWESERDRYHQLLIQKCYEHKRDTFFYRRILQLSESANIRDGILRAKLLTPTMLKHCRELLDFVRQFPEAAVLKHAPIFMQQVFVLIDDRYILWEIDATDPDTNKGYIDSLVILDDIEGEFVRYLRGFFLKVDAQSSIVRQIVD